MLTALRIADFAILEATELPLGPGLTAVTGETGAGKSILVDALALVLGGRATERVIRHGRDTAEIEAQFDNVTHPSVRALLASLGVEDEAGTLILRRVIGRNGVRRANANGRLVTGAQLRALAAPLCDLSSQHAQHRLLDPESHLEVLDRFAGLLPLRARHAGHHAEWRRLRSEQETLESDRRARADRMDYLQFVHKELTELDLKPGELADVQVRLQRIKASESLAKVVSDTSAMLGGDDGVRDLAGRAGKGLTRVASLDPKLAELAERALDLASLAGELATDVAQYGRTIDRDDRQLGRLAERVDAIHKALRKHGGSEEALLARRAAVAAELDTDTAELHLAELGKEVAKAAALSRETAAELATARFKAAQPLADRITDVVRLLGMPAATVRLELRSAADREPGATGWDTATLHLRANTGESEGPLHEVASGGELSRVLLAVQRACSDGPGSETGAMGERGDVQAAVQTCVYDEADAGLSGSTGLVLGRFLAEVGSRQQVLCISHLPQVAAAADVHVRVTKSEEGGRTRSVLTVLAEATRVDELARMLGTVDGDGDTALAHAQQLLTQQRRVVVPSAAAAT